MILCFSPTERFGGYSDEPGVCPSPVCPYVKLKLHLLSYYPSTWYICDFFLFHIEIEGKGGWIIGGGGGGGKGYVAPPPPKLLGGAAPPPRPLPTPMIYDHWDQSFSSLFVLENLCPSPMYMLNHLSIHVYKYISARTQTTKFSLAKFKKMKHFVAAISY